MSLLLQHTGCWEQVAPLLVPAMVKGLQLKLRASSGSAMIGTRPKSSASALYWEACATIRNGDIG
jgi:hypothetical protein